MARRPVEDDAEFLCDGLETGFEDGEEFFVQSVGDGVTWVNSPFGTVLVEKMKRGGRYKLSGDPRGVAWVLVRLDVSKF